MFGREPIMTTKILWYLPYQDVISIYVGVFYWTFEVVRPGKDTQRAPHWFTLTLRSW